jgi:hypothetical protein
MPDETIKALHPDSDKQGTNINRAKYDTMRAVLLDAIRARNEITFHELRSAAEQQLAGRFDGSIGWYVTTVKLDLEARGLIERVPKSSPQRLRLAGE